MIVASLIHSAFSESQARQSPKPPAARFQPLDPDIVSASIPTFFIGRDHDGFWLARDVTGENGGIFLFRSSAQAFARRASRPFGCAMVFSRKPFELDVENRGNPLANYLRPLIRLVAFARTAKAESGT